MMRTVWRGLDQVALDHEYNARATVPDYAAEARRYAELSAQARAALPVHADLIFDAESGCALDWFPGASGGPVLLWIHGGFWRALAKSEQSLVAPGLVAAGVHVAVMDYTLAPAASLDTMVHQARAALSFVAARASAHGADPARVFAGGHSAGGQLVGMLLAPGWHTQYEIRPDALRGAITVSGLFDLEPIRLSYVNEWLKLDPDAARRLSPLHHIPPGPAPRLLATVGGRETAEFRRQTEEYAVAWHAAGHAAQLAPQPTRHHFDIVVALGNAADPLCRTAGAFMEMD